MISDMDMMKNAIAISRARLACLMEGELLALIPLLHSDGVPDSMLLSVSEEAAGPHENWTPGYTEEDVASWDNAREALVARVIACRQDYGRDVEEFGERLALSMLNFHLAVVKNLWREMLPGYKGERGPMIEGAIVACSPTALRLYPDPADYARWLGAMQVCKSRLLAHPSPRKDVTE